MLMRLTQKEVAFPTELEKESRFLTQRCSGQAVRRAEHCVCVPCTFLNSGDISSSFDEFRIKVFAKDDKMTFGKLVHRFDRPPVPPSYTGILGRQDPSVYLTGRKVYNANVFTQERGWQYAWQRGTHNHCDG